MFDAGCGRVVFCHYRIGNYGLHASLERPPLARDRAHTHENYKLNRGSAPREEVAISVSPFAGRAKPPPALPAVSSPSSVAATFVVRFADGTTASCVTSFSDYYDRIQVRVTDG